MEKYRVRLKNGRVVGPFLPAQIVEMKDKGHVTGQESCQVFPTGEWMALHTFPFWGRVDGTPMTRLPDGTFVVNLEDLREELATPSDPAPEVPPPKKEPTRTEQVPPPSKTRSMTAPMAPPSPEPAFREFDYRKAHLHEPSEARPEATRVIVNEDLPTKVVPFTGGEPSPRQATSPEATVVSPTTVAWRQQLEEERRRQEEERLAALRAAEEEAKALAQMVEEESLPAPAEEVDILNEATQAINLKTWHGVEAETRGVEEELAREAMEQAKAPDEGQEETKKKKRRIIIVAAAVLLGYVVLFPEEDSAPKGPPQIKPMAPEIRFPVPFTAKDPGKAEELAKRARTLAAEATYPTKIEAAKLWRQSYENDTDLVSSRMRLVRAYGELIPHSAKFTTDAGTMFKMVQANRVSVELDPDVCLGTALFYKRLGKAEAAHALLERFVKSGANKPTKELFASYLESLVDMDKETTADEVATSLERLDSKGVEVTLALVRYHRYKNHPEKARDALEKGLRERPQSVPLLLSRAEFELEAVDMKALAATVKSIRALAAEQSRLYLGKVLELTGFIFAFQNKPTQAAEAFSEALKFSDGENLRERLTNVDGIDAAGNDAAATLIKQVKARQLVEASERALASHDFEAALLNAIKAQGLESGYLRAELHLADLQMRLGMVKESIDNLESLYKGHGEDPVIGFALLEAYIRTYKFHDARQLLLSLASSNLREDWRYASLSALLHDRMGSINESILWLQKAINLNPLEDENIFKLAQLLNRAKKFDEAKRRLGQAMELNPTKMEYRLAYGSILYETDGPDAAIAYLYEVLRRFPEDPAILGDIAIYYHRAGKERQFREVKERIEALPRRDVGIHRFLRRSAVLNENWDEAVKQAEEILKLEPGDLNVMMETGRMLMDRRRYKEAAQWFVRVRDKLPGYPRVGYYKARIELYVNNPDQALKDVSEDMKANGQYEEGLVLIGDILRSKNDYPGADAQYKSALKLNPRSNGALRGLASIAFKRGQLDVALDLFKRAVVGEPDNPEIHRQLGDIYRQQGQSTLAIESYRIYLKLLPEAQDKAQVEQYIQALE